MNHIRSTLVAGMLALVAAAAASAQQSAPAQVPQAQAPGAHGRQHAKGERGGMKHGGAMLKGIQLSAAEQASVTALHEKYAPQLKALRAQPKSDARRESANQLMMAERTDMRAALTPANQAKFDANLAQIDQRIAERKLKKGGHRTRPGAPVR